MYAKKKGRGERRARDAHGPIRENGRLKLPSWTKKFSAKAQGDDSKAQGETYRRIDKKLGAKRVEGEPRWV